MAKHYGVRARGLEIVTRTRTAREVLGKAVRDLGAALLFKIKVWLGWRVR
jgi:hypothetical protein